MSSRWGMWKLRNANRKLLSNVDRGDLQIFGFEQSQGQCPISLAHLGFCVSHSSFCIDEPDDHKRPGCVLYLITELQKVPV